MTTRGRRQTVATSTKFPRSADARERCQACTGGPDSGRGHIMRGDCAGAPDHASRVVSPGDEGYDDAFDICPEPTCPLYGKAVMFDHRHLPGNASELTL